MVQNEALHQIDPASIHALMSVLSCSIQPFAVRKSLYIPGIQNTLEAQMSTVTLSRHTSPDFFSRVVEGVAAFFEAVGEGRRIAQRYEALSRLSDAALATRGLTRQDIARVAVNGR